MRLPLLCGCSSIVAVEPIETMESERLWACPGRVDGVCGGIHWVVLPVLERE